jgi:DNA-3-methyladenine glycosylase
MKLKREFYTRNTLTVAKDLLGKYLVRKIGKKVLIGKIVETEAYIGPKDKASHAYKGKITPRNKAEYLEGGHIYIYLCYGMHWQLNITTSGAGKPECVLIRALEPVIKCKNQNANLACRQAGIKMKNQKSKRILKNLTNGPGKLCRWLRLDKSFYGEDLVTSKRIWLEQGEKIEKSKIVKSKRIGIDYAEEWKDKLWRFYIKDNLFVSRS